MSAYGGDAQDAGFMINGNGTTVLAFSLTGSVIPAGSGLLTANESFVDCKSIPGSTLPSFK